MTTGPRRIAKDFQKTEKSSGAISPCRSLLLKAGPHNLPGRGRTAPQKTIVALFLLLGALSPLVVPAVAHAEWQVGASRPFLYSDRPHLASKPTAAQPLTGRLYRKSRNADWWVDERLIHPQAGNLSVEPLPDGRPGDPPFTDTDLDALIELFENATPANAGRGLFDGLEADFGPLRTHRPEVPYQFFIYPIRPPNITCAPLAYHRDEDQQSAATNPLSNGDAEKGADLIFLHAAGRGLRENCNNTVRFGEKAQPDEWARELVRRQARSFDLSEENWIVDAGALYGSWRNGLFSDARTRLTDYCSDPTRPLTDVTRGRDVEPGAILLLGAYLAEQSGDGSALRDLLRDPERGYAGLGKIAKALDPELKTGMDLLTWLAAAIYLDANGPTPTIAHRFGFNGIDVPPIVAVNKRVKLSNPRAEQTDRVDMRPRTLGFVRIDTKDFGVADRVAFRVRHDPLIRDNVPVDVIRLALVKAQDPRAASDVLPIRLRFIDTPLIDNGPPVPRYEGEIETAGFGPGVTELMIVGVMWENVPNFSFELHTQGFGPPPQEVEPEAEIEEASEADADIGADDDMAGEDDGSESDDGLPGDDEVGGDDEFWVDDDDFTEYDIPRRDYGGSGGGCGGAAPSGMGAAGLLAFVAWRRRRRVFDPLSHTEP